MFVRDKNGAFISYTIPENDPLSKNMREQIKEVVKMYPQTQFFRGNLYNEGTWKTPDEPGYDKQENPWLVVTLPLDVSGFLFPKLLKRQHTPEQAAHFPMFFRKINGVLHLTVKTIVHLGKRTMFGWSSNLWKQIWSIPFDHVLGGFDNPWKELCLIHTSRIEPIEWVLTQRCVPRLIVESIIADVRNTEKSAFEKFLEDYHQSYHTFYNVLGKPEEFRRESEAFTKFYSNILQTWKNKL